MLSTVDSRRRGRVTPRVAYDSPSLPTNGVLYRNSSEAASVGHLPLHYWTSTAGLADLNRADLIADLNHVKIVKIASRIASYGLKGSPCSVPFTNKRRPQNSGIFHSLLRPSPHVHPYSLLPNLPSTIVGVHYMWSHFNTVSLSSDTSIYSQCSQYTLKIDLFLFLTQQAGPWMRRVTSRTLSFIG